MLAPCGNNSLGVARSKGISVTSTSILTKKKDICVVLDQSRNNFRANLSCSTVRLTLLREASAQGTLQDKFGQLLAWQARHAKLCCCVAGHLTLCQPKVGMVSSPPASKMTHLRASLCKLPRSCFLDRHVYKYEAASSGTIL